MERLAGTIILLTGWPRRLAALLAGAVLALALAPIDLFPAGFLAFPVLVWLIDGGAAPAGAGRLRRLWPAFSSGWWFGFGYFVAGLWWLGNAVVAEGPSLAWAVPLAVLGLPAVLAVFMGLGAAIARLLWSTGSGRIVALAFGLGLSELLRGVVLTGFPWNAVGHTLASNTLFMQSAALIGIEGLSAVAVLVFAAPALLATPRWRMAGVALPVAVLSAMTVFGFLRLPATMTDGPVLPVRLVQPSVAQNEKWTPEEADRIFAGLLDLMTGPALNAPAEADTGTVPRLVVWPETALPFLIEQRPDALTAMAGALAPGQILLTGGARVEGSPGDPSARFYNALIAINDGGEIIAAADKTHLVPFGEYVPFRSLLAPLGLDTIAETPGIFTPGPGRQTLKLGDGLPEILALICYEAIFPREVLSSLGDAGLIVNITNDAWYGRTPGPWQHFRQAQLRAVETGLPLVRVANNGLSGVVDPWGRISAGLALDVRGAVDAQVSLVAVPTPWRRHANAILAAIGAILFSVALAFRLFSR